MKRLIDILLSGMGMLVLLPVFALVTVGLLLSSPGPIFFRQERLGRHGAKFKIFKFRTMKVQKLDTGCLVTAKDDSRIFPFGSFLRYTKLDELPQLINVFGGDMTMVGPRPEVAEFANFYPEQYERILQVKPGITHSATLQFRREEEILATASDPRNFYIKKVLPEKLAAYEANLHQSLARDIQTIVQTIIPFGNLKPYGPEHFVPESACSIIPFPVTEVENIPAFDEADEAQKQESMEIGDLSSQIVLP